MGLRILASMTAVLGAAALTLACMIALVQGTIRAVSLDEIPLRILAVSVDFVFGTILLLGCIYLATHLAVRIVGVGRPNFLPCRWMSIPAKCVPAIPPKFSGIVLRACAKVSEAVRRAVAHAAQFYDP
jgi:hypothetical protein